MALSGVGKTQQPRDHGGGLDRAIARFGGSRADWIDLSTGINPVPYPIPVFTGDCWTALPDQRAADALTDAARTFWNVPDSAAILAAPGASALIARIPALAPADTVQITGPTYNEHAAAFRSTGWSVSDDPASAQVVVHPNNPDGRLAEAADLNAPLTIIDESFCDIAPDHSHINLASRPGTFVLKSFGKFWGLAGLRLGFVIGDPELVRKLSDSMGPWPVSGPALTIGAQALTDQNWAAETRQRLQQDSDRLDNLMLKSGARLTGGTPLFRLYHTDNAQALQTRLAEQQIWSRSFPYSDNWIRLGLPAPDQWPRVEAAI